MKGETVLTIGTFDGVHRGHRAILERVRECAEALRIPSVAYTFELPPRAAIEGRNPRLLLPPQIRYRLIGRYVDRVVPTSFSDVRSLSPERFIAEVIVGELAAKAIVVGERFKFGRGREGDIEVLRAGASRYGYTVEGVPPVTVRGEVVSSTLIRDLVTEGRIGEASRLLGRFPALFGKVIRGDRIGEMLGYPTANLRIPPEILLPASGVYLARAFILEGWEDGLLYIGTRPSVGGKELRCELHLFGEVRSDLYSLDLEIHILERLREDMTFPSLDHLRVQIGRDVERGRARLRDYPPIPERIGG